MTRATSRVKVEGLRELGESLRMLGEDVAKRAIYSATLKGARVVQQKASELAPRSEKAHRVGRRGPVVEPGNLARGIATKRLKQLKPGQSAYEVRWKAKKKGDPFYGLFVEFGTVKQPAAPFMRPAFDQSKEQAFDVMTDTLSKRIERAARKAKKRV